MELTMYVMDTHPDRNKRGMILGEIDVVTDDIEQSLEAHVSVINSPASFETEWCDGTNILPRQALAATWDAMDGPVGSSLTLSGLPDPCMLYVHGQPVEVTGGSYVHMLDTAREYLIEVNEARYERVNWVVTGT